MNRGSVKTHMKIALGQLNMAWEDKELSLQKVRKLTAQAAAGEADLIVFPEMSLTGFSMDIDRIGEDPDQPESVERMGRIAGEYHIAIGFGWAAAGKAAGLRSGFPLYRAGLCVRPLCGPLRGLALACDAGGERLRRGRSQNLHPAR